MEEIVDEDLNMKKWCVRIGCKGIDRLIGIEDS